MKNKMFSLLAVGTILIFASCETKGPTSSEMIGSQEAPTLAKGGPVMQVTWNLDASDPSLIVDPGTQVVDPSGVLHIRGLTFSGAPITGDLVGTSDFVFNADIILATGNARLWGTARDNVTIANRSVVFDTEFRGEVTGGVSTGRHRGQASEARIKGTQVETFPGSLVLNFSSEVHFRD